MHMNQQLYKKFSIGISFYSMTSQEWIRILRQYKSYIHDVFFSPIEGIEYQTRRNIYDYERQTKEFLEEELARVLDEAKSLGIYRKMVLNVPQLYEDTERLPSLYEKYKRIYDIEYVTTFYSCAKKIKEIDNTQPIVCSYNQGIKTRDELEQILSTNIFCTIVLGTNFFRDIESFRLVHSYGQKTELLLNNGCMRNCTSFCRFPNRYCSQNFEANLSKTDIDHLYAECSMFPEELHNHLLKMNLIDYYKLSTRPIHYGSMDKMLSSYIEGDSYKYILERFNNYNLYGRLAHFHQYYSELNYDKILEIKDLIWQKIICQ